MLIKLTMKQITLKVLGGRQSKRKIISYTVWKQKTSKMVEKCRLGVIIYYLSKRKWRKDGESNAKHSPNDMKFYFNSFCTGLVIVW